MYERTLMAGWDDMDFDSSMKNTAVLDKSADVRMLFPAEHDFPMREFVRLRIGPVLQGDAPARSGKGSRWSMRNEFYRPDGNLAAKVTSEGGWLDLAVRRLRPAPAALFEVLQRLSRTGDSRRRSRALGSAGMPTLKTGVSTVSYEARGAGRVALLVHSRVAARGDPRDDGHAPGRGSRPHREVGRGGEG